MTKISEKPERGVQHKRFSPALLLMIVTAIIGFGIALTVILAENASNSADVPQIVEQRSMAALIGQTAPDFALSDLEGETVRLSDLRGRVVFLNFWATWCIPCRREMPAFADFLAEQGEDGATILAVNDGESADAVRDFFDELGVQGIPTVLDRESTQRDRYGVFAMPTTFVIDEAGIIRAVKFGEMFAEDFTNYLQQISTNA